MQISGEILAERKELKRQKIAAVINYSENNIVCRTQQLLSYFGEERIYKCGKCDVCVERNKIDLSETEFEKIEITIKELLENNALSTIEITNHLSHLQKEKILKVLKWLSENEQVKLTDNKYIWIV